MEQTCQSIVQNTNLIWKMLLIPCINVQCWSYYLHNNLQTYHLCFTINFSGKWTAKSNYCGQTCGHKTNYCVKSPEHQSVQLFWKTSKPLSWVFAWHWVCFHPVPASRDEIKHVEKFNGRLHRILWIRNARIRDLILNYFNFQKKFQSLKKMGLELKYI